MIYDTWINNLSGITSNLSRGRKVKGKKFQTYKGVEEEQVKIGFLKSNTSFSFPILLRWLSIKKVVFDVFYFFFF